MGTETEVDATGETEPDVPNRSVITYAHWPQAAVVGGVAGLTRPLLNAVGLGSSAGILAALPEFQLWWVIHIGYSIVFGAGFGALVYHERLRSAAETLPTGTVLGLLYGGALWVGNVVLVWNFLLVEYAFTTAERIDLLAVAPLVDHLLFGLLLGLGYAIVVGRLLE
ncbi:hypothetical protein CHINAEXTREME_04190 [Halobiforma lacisalsi AJ5]|uniref:Histidine kinase n=1 Tax=Natronobacterium lacisalsi AJ5 TaxID=358396 RepID=M0LRQ1_NATLA|nr:hypothetical protein [Halobiforma lacisalsi]APW97019.1 hypothetical protein CHINAEXTREME_04190 [Halobiforma lacisalsi AJ5]EMA34735.1 hypothetical protein C445_07435 [Halobiforma lacisalsi AJ5]